MISKRILILSLIVLILLLGACSTRNGYRQAEPEVRSCHIIYDAGSSKTRLYVYELTKQGWVTHIGPKTGALADPVRLMRGKTMDDAGSVVDEIIGSLEGIRHDGPIDKQGKPKWFAFDWLKHCEVESIAVYATAGMRLAEQQDGEASKLLWKMLNDKLGDRFGKTVTTRTLSGYEEGLFAWLAIRENRSNGDFGVAEMGGASVQITYPCPQCDSSRQVKVKGLLVSIYSHSFLGWGQDEAWKKFKPLPACARGIGLDKPDWQIADCATGMKHGSDTDFEMNKPVSNTGELAWYLSGAFRYMQSTDIDHFCRKGIDSKFQSKTSCFRAVYLRNILKTLELPLKSEKTDVNWTLGAVVCTATRCL